MAGQETAIAARASLGRFRNDLSHYYGHHSVLHGDDAASHCRHEFLRSGPIVAGIAAGQGVKWVRDHARLDDMWHEHVFLVMQRTGRAVIDHLDRSVPLGSYDMVLVDSVGACDFTLIEGAIACYGLPRTWFDRRLGIRSGTMARRIDGSRGIGRLLSAMLTSFGPLDTNFDQEDREVVLESVLPLIERSLHAPDDLPRPPSEDRTLAHLKEWAMPRLGDPDTSPAEMARACGLSRRQLYRLFEDQGLTPSAWLWRLRLGVAHQMLRDQPKMPITEIAFAVGFNDTSHFSRLFKSHFEISPRALRRQLVV